MANNFDSFIKEFLEMTQDKNDTDSFEVIVKYHGDILRLETELNVEIEILNESYAIITLQINKIPLLYNYEEIEYIELPKNLTVALNRSKSSACIPFVQNERGYDLRGKGTIIGIIDSGIDYTHPDFRNEDGTSRILYIWDQTAVGKPPIGFRSGIEYNNNEINSALINTQPFNIIPQMDIIGHGTAVSGVAARKWKSKLW